MSLEELYFSVFVAIGYIFVQSLFILGIRVLAMGKTEIMPDGNNNDSETLLYPLFKFFTKKSSVKVFFVGRELEKLMNNLNSMMPNDTLRLANQIASKDEVIVFPEKEKHKRFNEILKNGVRKIDDNIEFEIIEGGAKFFKSYEKFRFSKYLRRAIIQCPIQMVLFWSIFSFWIPISYLYGFTIKLVFLWFINIFAVAALNSIIFSRYIK